MTKRLPETAFLTEPNALDSHSRTVKAIYFEDQRPYCSVSERRKKRLQDIPANLQFFYLNPRAGLTNKEKSLLKSLLTSNIDNLPNLEDEEFIAGPSSTSAAAAANLAPTTLELDKSVVFSEAERRTFEPERHHHDDWDEIRKLYSGARAASSSIVSALDHAIVILQLIEKKVRVSHRLEYLLDQRFKSIVEKLKLPTRRWQTESAVLDMRADRRSHRSAATSDRIKSSTSNMTTRSGSESEDTEVEKRADRITSAQLRSRSSKDFQDRRLSSLNSSRRPTLGRSKSMRRSDSIAESESERSTAFFKQTLRFVMSSSEAAAKGWLLTDDQDQQEQLVTIIEWCINRMHFSQHCDKQNANAVMRLFDDPPLRNDPYKLLTAVGNRPANRIDRNQLASFLIPKVPEVKVSQEKAQFVLLADKTVSVLYPSGRLCASRAASVRIPSPSEAAQLKEAANATNSASSLNATGSASSMASVSNNAQTQPSSLEKPLPSRFYTVVYADQEEPLVIAEFLPNGNGTCFRAVPDEDFGNPSRTVAWLQLTNDGYSFYDELGNPQKTMRWPANRAKLPGTITLQLSPAVSFRCDSRSDVSIFIHSPQTREVLLSIDVSPSSTAQETLPEGASDALYSNTKWKSKSARDIVAQTLAAHVQALTKSKRKAGRSTERSAKPEPTPVDDYQDTLNRLRRQCSQRVNDWLAFCNEVVLRTNDRTTSAVGEMEKTKSQLADSEITTGPTPQSMASAAKLVRSVTMPELKSRPGRVSPRCNTPYSQFMKSLELSDGSTFIYSPCPVLTRQQMLLASSATPQSFSLPSFNCHCSKHRITQVADVEFETFLRHCVPAKQLVIVIIVSSTADVSQSADSGLPVPSTYRVLDAVFREMNSKRTRPCFDGVNDKYRILEYDLVTAASGSTCQQPLLLRRHNVVPGMVLIYQGSRLLFCDHMFNGYGHSRKDFQLQIQKTLQDAGVGLTLPNDFKFVPKLKTVGPIDRYGSGVIVPAPVESTTQPVTRGPVIQVTDASKSATKASSSSDATTSSTRLRRAWTVAPAKTGGNPNKNSRIDINLLSANLA